MDQVSQKNHATRLYVLLAADLFAIILSYIAAVMIRFSLQDLSNRREMHYTICLCFLLFCTLFGIFMDWNKDFSKRGYLVELFMVLRNNAILFIAVGWVLFLIKQAEFFSRLLYGYFLLINIFVTYIFHVVIKIFMRRYLDNKHNRSLILLVLEQDGLAETVRDIKEHLSISQDICGIAVLDREEPEDTCEGISIVAGRNDLMEVARQLPLDEVFIKVRNLDTRELRSLIQDFESMGVLCHYSIDVIEWHNRESSVGKFGDHTVITYSLHNIDYQRSMAKRLMDIVGSLIGLLITALLTPIIALAIKINSRGPVFFSQTRIGKNGRRFKLYKFRSMYRDAEARKSELLAQNEMKGLMFKIEEDPRITKVGRFLRRTSLDELPQFWNVLKGDMSLVGTRPPTEDEFMQYSLYYRRRLSMTPGLTGMWQVSGRSDIEDFEEVVKLDLSYIDNWSLGLDIKILLKTIGVIFTGKGSK